MGEELCAWSSSAGSKLTHASAAAAPGTSWKGHGCTFPFPAPSSRGAGGGVPEGEDWPYGWVDDGLAMVGVRDGGGQVRALQLCNSLGRSPHLYVTNISRTYLVLPTLLKSLHSTGNHDIFLISIFTYVFSPSSVPIYSDRFLLAAFAAVLSV